MATLVACLSLASAHALLVWRHVPLFWGDSGRWMHEVQRFAAGERLYVDFTWPFPPLAAWVLGMPARYVGVGVAELWGLTCVLYFMVVAVAIRYVVALVPSDLALPSAIATLLWIIAYGHVGGAALPMGTYSPAALVGGLCYLVAITALVSVLQGNTTARCAAVLGAAAALAVLAKQDFWAPALAIVVIGLANAPSWRRRVLIAAVTALPVILGYALAAWPLGVDGLIQMIGGFGHVEVFGGLGLPSGRRIAAEFAAAGAALLGGLVIVRPGNKRWWLLPVALVGTSLTAYFVATGSSALRLAEADLHLRGLSVFLPLIVLVWVWRRRAEPMQPTSRLVLALLVVAIAARARRGFESLAWYHAIVELPIYILAVRAIVGVRRRALQLAAVAMLIPVGAYLYWHLGRGPLTAVAGVDSERLETPRGWFYAPPDQVGDFHFVRRLADSLDPTGQRGLFAFGYTGGWSYFLGRTNPTPAPHGFRLTRLPPDSVLALAERARPIVLDALVFTRIRYRDYSAGLLRWEAPEVQSHYMTFDRFYFDQLIADCPTVGRHPERGRTFFVVHDCADPEL